MWSRPAAITGPTRWFWRRPLAGAVSLGSFTFLTGAFNRSRAYIEKILSGFNDISEQAVFLKDLFEFFAMEPTIAAAPDAIPGAPPDPPGIRIPQRGVRLCGQRSHGNPKH